MKKKKIKMAEVENSYNVQEMLNEMGSTRFGEFDTRSMWLSQFRLLTSDYLNTVISKFYLSDISVRKVELKYDRFKYKIDIDIYLKRWAYWFRYKKVLTKITWIINSYLSEFDVDLSVYKYIKGSDGRETKEGQGTA